MITNVLNIGLIGAGRIGMVHAGAITNRVPRATITAVADVFEDAAKRCAAAFGIPRATSDVASIINDPAIQAVMICSVTETHAPLIEQAAAAGKHIFCEKPIALNLAQIDKALAEVESAGVQLQIGFNRRFDANFKRARQAVASGEIGTPHMLHIISRDPAPPPIAYVKNSGGIFLDMTIHDFDMARFLIGDEVESLYVQAAVRIDPEIGAAGDVDTAMIMMRFKNGVIATIDNSRKAVYGYDQRVEVFGSGGAVATGNNYPNSAVISNDASVRRDLPLNFFMDRYTEAYTSEIEGFIAAISDGKPVPVTGRDGREATRLGLAAKRSLAEGRPVLLSEII